MTESAAASASRQTTTFNVLGPIAVCHGADPVGLGGPRQVAVLARLLISVGHTVSMEQLVDAVWDGDAPSRPEVTIRSYVSNLRRIIEPERRGRNRRTPSCIENASPGYRLAVDADSIDSQRFELAVEAGRRALAQDRDDDAIGSLADALELWRGEPYEAVTEGDAVMAARSRLGEVRLVAIESITEALLRRGDHEDVLSRLGPALIENPLRERLTELAMLALYRSGRQSEALARCAELRSRLVDGLGIDPGPAVQELERKILRHDETLLLSRPVHGERAPIVSGRIGEHRLATEPIVDRVDYSEALRVVGAAVEERDSATVLVTGEPGSGKSTLIGALTRRIGSIATVLTVSCRPLMATQPLWPWAQLLASAGDDEQNAEAGHLATLHDERATMAARTAAVVAALRGLDDRPLLVVLEDLHASDPQSIEALGHVAEELVDSAIVFVATWRDTEPMLPENRRALRGLARLPGLTRAELGGLDPDAIEQLIGPGHSASAEVARRLHQLSAGNPFFVAELSCDVAFVGDDLDVSFAPTPTTNLREAVRDRVEQVHPQATEVLVAAALVDGVFTADLLVGAIDLPISLVDDVLERALAAGLLAADRGGTPGYRFVHPIVQTVLVDEISPPRRARLHLALGHAMWRLGWQAIDAAAQFAAAGSPETDLLAARFAIDAAADSYDSRIAAEAARICELVLARLPAVSSTAEIAYRCHRLLGQWARVRGDNASEATAAERCASLAARLRLTAPDAGSVGPIFDGPAIGRLDQLGPAPVPLRGSGPISAKLERLVSRNHGRALTNVAALDPPDPGPAAARSALAALAHGTSSTRATALRRIESLDPDDESLADLANRLRTLEALCHGDRALAESLVRRSPAGSGGPGCLHRVQRSIVASGLDAYLGSGGTSGRSIPSIHVAVERLEISQPRALRVLRAQLDWLGAAGDGHGLGQWVAAERNVLLAAMAASTGSPAAEAHGISWDVLDLRSEPGVLALVAGVVGGEGSAVGASTEPRSLLAALVDRADSLVVSCGGSVLHGPGSYYAGCAALWAGENDLACELFDAAIAHGGRLDAWPVTARALVRRSELGGADGAGFLEEARRLVANGTPTEGPAVPIGLQSFPNDAAAS